MEARSHHNCETQRVNSESSHPLETLETAGDGDLEEEWGSAAPAAVANWQRMFLGVTANL